MPVVEAGRDRLGEAACGRVARAHLLPYQQAWIEDRSRVRVWEKSRRIGADYAEGYGSVRDRILGLTDTDYWYSSADESAAVEQAEYCKHFLGLLKCAYQYETGEDLDEPGAKVMTITLPSIGGRTPRLSFMTSSPKRFRSKGGDVCLSEFAFHARAGEMWKAATPTATWGGRVSVISTHNGEHSEFNALLNQARRHTDPATYGQPRETDLLASIHRVTIDDAIAQGLVDKINDTRGSNMTADDFRADLRRTCADEDRWLEEYMCVPSAQSASYFPTVLLRTCLSPHAAKPTEDLGLFLAAIAERVESMQADRLTAGCDVGRTNDRFVIWVWGRVGLQRICLGTLVYQGRSFAEMETAIHAVMGGTHAGQRVRRMCIDSTGLGMQLAERMEDKWRTRVEGVNFTAAVKEDIFSRLRAGLEERTVLLPDDDRVLADMTTIRREITAAGNSRYSAEANANGHADIATAAALGLMADESAKSVMRMVPVKGGLL